MSSVVNEPEVFESKKHGNYVLVGTPSGHWVDKTRRPCDLVSINVFGDTKRIVTPYSQQDGDSEAIDHFSLSPWRQAGAPDRRRADSDRRNWKRRASGRRKTDRPAADQTATD